MASALLPKNRQNFLVHPERDFIRNRKISLEDLIFHLFSRSSGSLTHNLQIDFGLGDGRPSKSALVQQQAKLKEEFFQHLFDSINGRFRTSFLYKGRYRLLACDGSDVGVSSQNSDCYRTTNQTGRDFCCWRPPILTKKRSPKSTNLEFTDFNQCRKAADESFFNDSGIIRIT